MSGSFGLAFGGFNYDQSAAPGNPLVGQTWRQRNGSNNILGSWEWNGTFWISIQKFSHNSFGTCQTSGGNFTSSHNLFTGGRLAPLFIQSFEMQYRNVSGTNDASNYWFVEFLYRSAGNQIRDGFFNWGTSYNFRGQSGTGEAPSPTASIQKLTVNINQFVQLPDIIAFTSRSVRIGSQTQVIDVQASLLAAHVYSP